MAVDETAAPYRAIPLWGALPPDSGASRSAPGRKTEPFSPHVTIVERPRIEDLAITVTFPGYMERDPELVPPTEGEVHLPRGACRVTSA